MEFLETLLRDRQTPSTDFQALLFAFLLSFVMGQIIGWVYQKTHRGMSYSQSFTASMVVLPVLVGMMMLLMADNLGIAFGLLAVFAVVRFRNVLKDTRDTIFVLWAIIEGMAVGTGRASLAMMGIVFIGLIMFYLAVSRYGARTNFDTIVNLLFSDESGGATESINGVFARHSLDSKLASVQEVAAGQLDASYRLTLRDPNRRLELEADLRSLDQVQRVSVFIHEDESEA
ncbi:MAG: DUF4956 domain-containing protein [Planctomycetota bacterium]